LRSAGGYDDWPVNGHLNLKKMLYFIQKNYNINDFFLKNKQRLAEESL
jgi:hypothetical protein